MSCERHTAAPSSAGSELEVEKFDAIVANSGLRMGARASGSTYVDSDAPSLSGTDTDASPATQPASGATAASGTSASAIAWSNASGGGTLVPEGQEPSLEVLAEAGAMQAVAEGVHSWAQFRGGNDQVGLEHLHPELRDVILERGLRWTWGGSEFEKLKRVNLVNLHLLPGGEKGLIA